MAGHLLPSLGDGTELEFHHLSFLQTVCLAGHADNAKRVALALSGTLDRDRQETAKIQHSFYIFGLLNV